jgi:hypothetical protein
VSLTMGVSLSSPFSLCSVPGVVAGVRTGFESLLLETCNTAADCAVRDTVSDPLDLGVKELDALPAWFSPPGAIT